MEAAVNWGIIIKVTLSTFVGVFILAALVYMVDRGAKSEGTEDR